MVLLKCVADSSGAVFYVPADKLVAYSVSPGGLVKVAAPYPNGSFGFIVREFDGTEADLLALLENI